MSQFGNFLALFLCGLCSFWLSDWNLLFYFVGDWFNAVFGVSIKVEHTIFPLPLNFSFLACKHKRAKRKAPLAATTDGCQYAHHIFTAKYFPLIKENWLRKLFYCSYWSSHIAEAFPPFLPLIVSLHLFCCGCACVYVCVCVWCNLFAPFFACAFLCFYALFCMHQRVIKFHCAKPQTKSQRNSADCRRVANAFESQPANWLPWFLAPPCLGQNASYLTCHPRIKTERKFIPLRYTLKYIYTLTPADQIWHIVPCCSGRLHRWCLLYIFDIQA